jgi:hypothetical protein
MRLGEGAEHRLGNVGERTDMAPWFPGLSDALGGHQALVDGEVEGMTVQVRRTADVRESGVDRRFPLAESVRMSR